MLTILGSKNEHLICFDDFTKKFWSFPCFTNKVFGDLITDKEITLLGIRKKAHISKSIEDTLVYVNSSDWLS